MSKRKLPVSLLAGERTWGIRYLLFQLVFLGGFLSSLMILIGRGSDNALLNFVYYTVNLLAVLWIFRRFLWKSAKEGLSHWIELLIAIALGLGVYLILTPLVNTLIEYIQPAFDNTNDQDIGQNFQSSPLLTFVGTVFLVPLAEEVMHRGLIFGSIHSKNRWLAYVLSTLFFAFIHISNYIFQVPSSHLVPFLLQYIPAGLVLAWAYEYSGSLLAPFLIHTAVNAIAIYSEIGR